MIVNVLAKDALSAVCAATKLRRTVTYTPECRRTGLGRMELLPDGTFLLPVALDADESHVTDLMEKMAEFGRVRRSILSGIILEVQ